MKTGAVRLLWSMLVPAFATVLIMRFLVPSRIEGGGDGVLAAVARFADELPLVVGLALFFAVGQVVRYWRDQRRGAASTAGVASSAAGLFSNGRSLARLAGWVALAVVLALIMRKSLVQTYRVMSPSMVPTLGVGDRLLVNKLAYGLRLPFAGHALGGGRVPRRGDVIVFQAGAETGETGPSKVLVKRVVGLPGDRVASEDGRVVLNGRMVPRCDVGPYASLTGRLAVKGRLALEAVDDRIYLTVWTPGEQPSPEFTVPPGQVFVIGDDRGFSSDSRIWNDRRGAGVPIASIEGRVSRILAGTRADGRLDVGRLLAPLDLRVRQPGVDLHVVEQRIAACAQSLSKPQ